MFSDISENENDVTLQIWSIVWVDGIVEMS